MTSNHVNRLLLGVAVVSTFGLGVLAMWVLNRPDLGVASFFFVPTCLLAFSGGPRAGAAGALISTALFILVRLHNLDISGAKLAVAGIARGTAFVCGGVFVGLFAERNRMLVEQLRQAAECDFLTGLGNTRAFETALQRRCQDGRPFTLLLGDTDSLKEINDQAGHAAGDLALKRLATALRDEIRPGDEAARIGGDEFAILTTAVTAEEARAIVGRLEQRSRAARCPATFGWAIYPSDAAHQIGLFNVADGRLYARKPGARTQQPALPTLRMAFSE